LVWIVRSQPRVAWDLAIDHDVIVHIEMLADLTLAIIEA